MAMALTFTAIAKLAAESRKAFDRAVLESWNRGEFRDGFGRPEFDHDGPIAITVDKSTKVSPQWKEEAAAREIALHELAALLKKGDVSGATDALEDYMERFDRDKWEASVRKTYEETSSWSPKLTESL
jgi:hypothetical protein